MISSGCRCIDEKDAEAVELDQAKTLKKRLKNKGGSVQAQHVVLSTDSSSI